MDSRAEASPHGAICDHLLLQGVVGLCVPGTTGHLLPVFLMPSISKHHLSDMGSTHTHISSLPPSFYGAQGKEEREKDDDTVLINTAALDLWAAVAVVKRVLKGAPEASCELQAMLGQQVTHAERLVSMSCTDPNGYRSSKAVQTKPLHTKLFSTTNFPSRLFREFLDSSFKRKRF